MPEKKKSKAIWSTGTEDATFNQRLHEICFKTNIDYDSDLLCFDIESLIAHGEMLAHVGLITIDDGKKIVDELKVLKADSASGSFCMTVEWEDCHSMIESELIARIGDIGKKLYVARSRNDQIINAIRLYAKDRLQKIRIKLLEFMKNLLSFSSENEFVPMPGYTHTQRAMPSSIGMWGSSFLEILLNQKDFIDAAISLNDMNVMGSAAGFGTGFDIDRDFVTAKLGMSKTQVNSLSCQLSRGQVECQTLQSLWGVMFVINRLANDMVWMTSAEFDFLDIHKSCTTGSSIMPNKKNLDPCEIIRARYHLFCGNISQIQGMVSNLFSGYNSDFQETKPVFMDALNNVLNCIEVMNIMISNTNVKQEKLMNAFSADIYATEQVNDLVAEGESFRDAYIKVKKSLNSVNTRNPIDNIKNKKHIGSTGNLGLEIHKERLNLW